MKKRKALAWILLLCLLLPAWPAAAFAEQEEFVLDPDSWQSGEEFDASILTPDNLLASGEALEEEPPPQEEETPAISGGELVLTVRPDGVFQNGDLYGEQITPKSGFSLFALLPDTMALLQQAIRTAVENMSATVDLTPFAIPYADQAEITAACSAVINSNPQFFYWNSIQIRLFGSDGTFTRIALDYYDGAVEMRTAYEAEAASIISTFTHTGMSDTEKALALHDALALQMRYHNDAYQDAMNSTTTPYVTPYPNAYNAYGAVVEKHAVCQGYALAYIDLLKRVGVDALFVPSSSMSHAWNIVKVNGAWYHVDITHDDPLYSATPDGNRDLDGAVSHRNVLLSSTEITATGHSGHAVPDGVTVSTASHPDKAFWSGVNTGMLYGGGQWYTTNISISSAYGYGRQRGSLQSAAYQGTKTALLADIAAPVRDGSRLYFFKYESASSLAGNICYYDMETAESGVELVIAAGYYVAELYAPGDGRLRARILEITNTANAQDRVHIIGSTYGADYTVSLTGTPQIGETLTAAVGNAPSGLKLRWFRSADALGTGEEQITGAEGSTYVPAAADAGMYIKAEAYVEGAQGKAESQRLGPVMKLVQTAVPAAPTASAVGDTSVTLAELANAEYAYGASAAAPGSAWQASPLFTGLTAGETYYFFARLKETSTHTAGPSGPASAPVTTYLQVYALSLAALPGGCTARMRINGVDVTAAPAGALVQVSAVAGEGYAFSGWSAVPGVTFVDASAPSTTFTMPANAVALTAAFTEKAQPLLSLNIPAQGYAYDGTAKPAPLSATGYSGYVDEAAFLADVTLTYDGQADVPVNAGAYAVQATYAGNNANKRATASGTLTISRAQWASPTAPVIDADDRTETSITHASVAGLRYLLQEAALTAPTVADARWREGTGAPIAWAGLTPASAYKLYAYQPEDRNHTASDIVASEAAYTLHTWALESDMPELRFFARTNVQAAGVTITLTNTGTGALSNLSVSKSIQNANMFTLTSLSATALAAGESATLTVTPEISAAADTVTATLRIDAKQAEAGQTDALPTLVVPLTLVVADKATVAFSGLEAQSAAYSGAQQAYDAAAIVPSVEAGEDAYTGAFDYSYAGTAADGTAYDETDTPPTDAGSYTFTVKVPDTAPNHMGSASASYTILPKPVTVTGMAVTARPYDGTAQAAITGGVLTGVLASDDAGVSHSALPSAGTFDSIHQGTNKPVYIPEITLTGARAPNYALTQPALAGTVTPRAVTPQVTAAPREYDGTAAASTLTVAFAPGDILANDAVRVSYPSAAFQDKNAGENKPVTLGARQVTGNAYGDYAVTDPTGVQGAITPRRVTVSLSGQAQAAYDGSAKALSAAYAAVAGDTPGVRVLYSGAAEAPVLAGVYALSVELTDGNYTLDTSLYEDGISAGPRSLTITRGTLTGSDVTRSLVFTQRGVTALSMADFGLRPAADGAAAPEGSFTRLAVEDESGILDAASLAFADSVAFALSDALTAASVGDSASIRVQFVPVPDTYAPITLIVRVQVVAEDSTSMVSGAPTTVNLGEELDTSTIRLVTTLDSGAVLVLEAAELTISGYTKDSPPYNTGMLGARTVTVTDPENPHRTASFTLTVVDVVEDVSPQPPAKTQYQWRQDGTLDLTGAALQATMRSGEVRDIPITADMLSGYSLSTLGSYPVSLTYEGKTVEYFTLAVERWESVLTPPAAGQPGVLSLTDETAFRTDGAAAEAGDVQLRIRAVAEGEFPALNSAIAGASQFASIRASSIQRLDISLWNTLLNREAELASGSINIQLPYPDGTDSLDTFYILHRKKSGEVSVYTPAKSANGLAFTVTGFSPFAIGWVKYTGGGNGGSGGSGGHYGGGIQGGWLGFTPTPAVQERQLAFWAAVRNAILGAEMGSVIRVNARVYDQMPVSVMNALRQTKVTLQITWDGGNSIRITSAKALTPEATRAYYPLKLLEELFPAQAQSAGSSSNSGTSSSSSSSSGSSSSGSSGSGSTSSSSSSSGSTNTNTAATGNGTDEAFGPLPDDQALSAAATGQGDVVDLDAPVLDEDERGLYTPETEGLEPLGEEEITIMPPVYTDVESTEDAGTGGTAAHWLLFACVLLLLGAVGVAFAYLMKRRKA